MATKRGDHRLTIQIAVAIVLAILTALLLPHVVAIGQDTTVESSSDQLVARANYILVPLRLGGEVFLRLLKMLVVPLVIVSVMSGILGLGDVRKLGKPGLAAVSYYLVTTILAVFVGIILVNLMNPGGQAIDEATKAELVNSEASVKEKVYSAVAEHSGTTDDNVASIFGDDEYTERKNPRISRVLENLILMMFTDNLVRSAANMELLPLIFFSIFFAGLLTTLGSRVDLIVNFIQQMNDALMSFILLIMRFAPLGIFCLVAARFGQANVHGEFFDELRKTGSYSLTVLTGLAVHAFITLPAILYFFTHRNPYKFMFQMSQALLTAFSTGSSSATLPVTMESAVDEGNISKKSVDFVLPLGATINMDGTALYEAVAAIFIAQVVGADLTLSQQLIVAVTATLAAIGAAGIPEAGLVTMVIVLTAVGLPIEYMSLILSVDWLLDRFRTTVNVFGDACGAAVVEKTFPPEELIADSV
ncbi:dicarboxylate/amino acid:cation symporter [Thalassoglobus polymorphus]|uniref:Proton glutamate symport protein n=1 Tax=Thalassoglobus polymorphus TaxID=2527994 RepID=A0A517QS43_9PLAN|nr:dicarboxylate/amino acid:cation symporter [Thalassoglobus polymorphus]QDT34431.1 Proton glutamate symport protein [Thalassoglobus polymorphus]